LQIRAITLEAPVNDLLYTIERDGVLLTEGNLQSQSETSFLAELSLTVNTSRNTTYSIYVYESDNTSGQRLQGRLQIRGRTVSPPIIEEVSNPEEVIIPESGSQRIDFFARVVHPNGQELINSVNFFLIDQSDSSVRGEYQMFDNGEDVDEVESDSLYSGALSIEEGAPTFEITVNYYAIGEDGQSSDTLQTQLSIIE